jgi:fibronectin-binding autotransporter adhesin
MFGLIKRFFQNKPARRTARNRPRRDSRRYRPAVEILESRTLLTNFISTHFVLNPTTATVDPNNPDNISLGTWINVLANATFDGKNLETQADGQWISQFESGMPEGGNFFVATTNNGDLQFLLPSALIPDLQAPAHGFLRCQQENGWSGPTGIYYDADPGYWGSDSFTYIAQILDNSYYPADFGYAVGQVTVNVQSAPQFSGTFFSTFTTLEEGSCKFSVQAHPTASVTLVGAPSWLDITDNKDGTYTLNGKPPADSQPSYNFTIQASNGVGSPVTEPFLLNVKNNSFTWAGKGNGKWSDPKDWQGNAVPTSGSNLIFPAGAPTTSTNNITGLTLGNIQIGGAYTLTGDAITLNGTITATAGKTTDSMPITLDGSGGDGINVSQGAELIISDPLTGSDGIIKSGPGELDLTANDSLSGGSTLEQGTVDLTKLGTGDIVVQSQGTVTLDLGGKAPELDNALSIKSGTLDIVGANGTFGGNVTLADQTTLEAGATGGGTDMAIVMPQAASSTPADNFIFNGTMTLSGNSTLKAAKGESIVVSSVVGSGNLTVEGPGTVYLSKEIAAGVTVTAAAGAHVVVNEPASLDAGSQLMIAEGGQVDFSGGGSGAVIVNGGILDFQRKRDLDGFTGTITLQAGTVMASGNDLAALSAATLIVKPTGPATLKGSQHGVLDNPVQLEGGQLSLGNTSVAFTGTITVSQDTEIDGPGRLQLGHLPTGQTPVQPGSDPSKWAHLAGGGQLSLVNVFCDLTPDSSLDAGSQLVSGEGTRVILESEFPAGGSGSVSVDGGSLEFASPHATGFSGLITLQAGTIKVNAVANAQAPMGTATLVVDATEKVNLEGSDSLKTLENPILLQGGTVDVKGNFEFDGQVTVQDDTEIDPLDVTPIDPQIVVHKNVAGSGNLTLGGPGKVFLNGIAAGGQVTAGATSNLIMGVGSSLDAGSQLTIARNGTVVFAGTGSGAVTLNGGTLDFSREDDVDGFKGTITLQAGTVVAAGNDLAALSAATLVVKTTGNATLKGSGHGVLSNPVQLQGGRLTLGNSVTFTGTITVSQNTEIDGPGRFQLGHLPTGQNPFRPGPDPSKWAHLAGSGQLTLVGVKGDLAVDSSLDAGSQLVAGLGTTVLMESESPAGGSGSVTVNGGTLEFDNPVPSDFSGTITLQAGTIKVDAGDNDANPMGTATLVVNGKGLLQGLLNRTKTLPNVILLQGGTLGLVGHFAFAGPITVSQPTGILLSPNADLTITGAVGGGQSVLVSGPGTVRLKSSIGTTKLTAGPGSTVILYDGFSEADGHIPVAIGVGVVVDKRTK